MIMKKDKKKRDLGFFLRFSVGLSFFSCKRLLLWKLEGWVVGDCDVRGRGGGGI